jgi:hypothetical protein
MKLVDSCFSNNKLSIKFDINKDINIIIKYPILYDELECSLKLIKTESNINEKFEIILNEISLLKKDKNIEINEKFKNIEKLILDLKDNISKKLEDNLNMINELKDKIEKNKNNLINNNKEEKEKEKENNNKINKEFIEHKEKYEKTVNEILVEEKNCLENHKSHIDDMVLTMKNEMNLINIVEQKSNVDEYVDEILNIFGQQENKIQVMKQKLLGFKRLLKEENELSQKITILKENNNIEENNFNNEKEENCIQLQEGHEGD